MRCGPIRNVEENSMKMHALCTSLSIALLAVTTATPVPAAADEGAQVTSPVEPAADEEPAPEDSTPARDSSKSTTRSNPTEIERITVTGTRIRGGETPSPVVTIGS